MLPRKSILLELNSLISVQVYQHMVLQKSSKENALKFTSRSKNLEDLFSQRRKRFYWDGERN